MNQSLPRIMLSLVVLLNAAYINATHLIWVNATDVPLQVTGAFHVQPGSNSCSANLNQHIEPRGVFVHNISGCQLSSATIHIGGHTINANNIGNVYKGLFVIRPNSRGSGFELEGPYSDVLHGGIFVVNATGHDMQYYSEYQDPSCGIDRGHLAAGAVKMIGLGAACSTKLLYGHDIAVGGVAGVRTNDYTGVVGKGTFVFRKKAGTQNQFEVAGPFMQ